MVDVYIWKYKIYGASITIVLIAKWLAQLTINKPGRVCILVTRCMHVKSTCAYTYIHIYASIIMASIIRYVHIYVYAYINICVYLHGYVYAGTWKCECINIRSQKHICKLRLGSCILVYICPLTWSGMRIIMKNKKEKKNLVCLYFSQVPGPY